MGTSHVSIIGALRPLREGHEQDPLYGSAGVALWALENLLDGPEGYRTDNVFWSGSWARCASGRHGNCLSFRVLTPNEYAYRVDVFGEPGTEGTL